jgi:hypothetical protein
MVVVTPAGKLSGMQELMAKGGYSTPVLAATSNFISHYGVRGYPTLVVLDEQGAVADTIVGKINFLRLSRVLDDVTGG